MDALPSEWIAAGLILAALILIAVDLHLVGQGLLAAGGVVALLVAALLLAIPSDVAGWPVRSDLVLVTLLLYLGFAVVAVRGALTVRRLGRAGPLLPAPGRRALALTDLAPTGIVRYRSEEWSATADAGLPPVLLAASGQNGGRGGGHATTNRLGLFGRQPLRIRAGDAVEVVAVDGLQLRVRRIAVIALPSMEVRD